MPTLTTVYHNINRDKFPFDLRLKEPTTYLKTLGSQPNQQVVLAFKRGPPPPSSVSSRPVNNGSRKREKSDDLDLTGTPLEDDCEIDVIDESLLNMNLNDYRQWTDEEETIQPISTHESRELLHHVNRIDCNRGSVWMLCQSEEEPSTIMLQWEYDQKWSTRGVVKFTGLHSYDQIEVARLIKKHCGTIHGSVAVTTHIQTQFIIQPFLTMQLSWNTTSSSPSLSSFRNADILLYQTVRLGNNSSAAIDYWRQLIRLNQIKEQIIAYKEDEDRNSLVFASGGGLSIGTIKEGIIKIISDLTPILAVSNDCMSADLEPIIKRSLDRQMVEITDQLWMLLKFCASYEDLKTAFTFLFHSTARCNVVNVPMNENRVAELIREISQKRVAVPCLAGAEPLELLLEIGLEKAAKDYEFIFTESKICCSKDLNSVSTAQTANNLDANAVAKRHTRMLRNEHLHEDEAADGNEFQNSTFNRMKCDNKLNHLAHIHLLMEHLLLIQIHLDWSDMRNYVLEDLKRSPKPFAAFKTLFEDKREIPILSTKVIGKVEGRQPNLLKLVMQSSNRFFNVQNTFVYSTSSIFPINVFPMMQNEEINPAVKTMYSGVHYLKIGSAKQ